MLTNLGNRRAVGVQSLLNRITPNGWLCTFATDQLFNNPDAEVWHGSIVGPGGYFLVYLDSELYGVGANGKINEYAPSIPMYVMKGQTITLHWSISTGAAPLAVLYFRIPRLARE